METQAVEIEESSEFECPECGCELDEEDTCWNSECPSYGEEVESGLAMSDWQERQHERSQMGISL